MTAHIVTAYAPTITADPPEWTLVALCLGIDPEIFYPPAGSDAARVTREAKRICDLCPVRTECLTYALSHGEVNYGVWGGLTPLERRQLAPRPGRGLARARRNPARCGTEAGYGRHKRLGEPACRPCLDALSAAQRRRTSRTREQARQVRRSA